LRAAGPILTASVPARFRPYAEIEAAATQLRSWQPSFVDGLLQTEAYARCDTTRVAYRETVTEANKGHGAVPEGL
jgi:hypothetical protein